MKKAILFLVLFMPVWIHAQEADTTYAKQIIGLELQVDSLRRTIWLWIRKCRILNRVWLKKNRILMRY